jgi:hypothetical protein
MNGSTKERRRSHESSIVSWSLPFDDARAGCRGAVRTVDSQGPVMFDSGLWWMGCRVLDSDFVHEAYALT